MGVALNCILYLWIGSDVEGVIKKVDEYHPFLTRLAIAPGNQTTT